MRRLKGVNNAAIRRVEATTARVDLWPVSETNTLRSSGLSASKRAHIQPTRARRQGGSFRRLLAPVPLPLPSQPYSTAPPSPERYESSWEYRFLSRREPNPEDLPTNLLRDVCFYLLLRVLLCLDIHMNSEADFIKEIRYLAGLMRQNCHDASWRMERLLSKVEQGESLDTRSTSIQLSEARDELQRLMRGIEGIQKLCELESDDR
jgi:hypothetical protein